MSLTRRNVLGAAAALSLGTMFTQQTHARLYTSKSAPDRITSDILAGRLPRMDQGCRGPHDFAYAINRNFRQIVEQGLASMSPARLSWHLSRMSEIELASLAQLYINSTTEFGYAPRALNVFALRLQPFELLRLARHFGSEPVYVAIANSAPAKLTTYLSKSDTWWRTPSFSAIASPVLNAGPTVDMTPLQIFQGFRNGTLGSLSLYGALYESSAYMVPRFSASFGAGYAVGTYIVAPLIQNFAPTLWEAIGMTIESVVTPLKNAITGPEKRNVSMTLQHPMDLI
jgi:hypothetical protein